MAQNLPSKLRVMLDANILVAGIGWPRFPSAVLQHAFRGDYQLVLTEGIIEEARTTVYDVLPDRAQALDQFLQEVDYELVLTPTDEEIAANANLVRDPKDVHVALAAINANVDYLISQDKDLTVQDDSTKALRERLNIMLPGTFLREYMGWTSEALEAIRQRTWRDLD